MAKLTTLDDALARVEDGMHLGLTGFAITRNSVAASLELIRAGRRGLLVTQVIGGLETDLLVAAGCVNELNYSGGSLDRFGPLHSVNRAISSGALVVHEYSSLSLTLRLLAGSLGLPYVPARTLLGSDLLGPLRATGAVRMGQDPFTGSPVVLLAPLRPDVALVHADVCDEDGNASVSGPTWALRETAMASRQVIVTTEEVVPAGVIAPERVTVPGAVVSAVVPAPSGGRPTAVHGRYDYDREALTAYVAAARSATPEIWELLGASREPEKVPS